MHSFGEPFLSRSGDDDAGGGSAEQTRVNPFRKPRPIPAKFQLPEVGNLLGKCLLTEMIATGSSCAVYRALHTTLKVPVAVKVLLPKSGDEAPALNLSTTEARLLARLDHPSITRVLDFDEAGPASYLVLEYLDGFTLRDLILQSGAVRQGRALTIALQVAEGLAYASEHGIIHRDVKPANILLTREGRAKIADLGLAKLVGDGVRGLAETGPAMIVGTPAYMAPEQALGRDDVDERADIYSLGATLFHAVTGRMPFESTDPIEVMRMHVEEPLTNPTDFSAAIEPCVSELIDRMMAKDPAGRFQGYGALLAAMRAVGEVLTSVSSSSGRLPRIERAADRSPGGRLLGVTPSAAEGSPATRSGRGPAASTRKPAAPPPPPPRGVDGRPGSGESVLSTGVRAAPAPAPAPAAAKPAKAREGLGESGALRLDGGGGAPGRPFAGAWALLLDRLGGRRSPLALEKLPLAAELEERPAPGRSTRLRSARYSLSRADGPIAEVRLVAIEGQAEDILSARVFPARPDRLPVLAVDLVALRGEARLAFVDLQTPGLEEGRAVAAGARGGMIAAERPFLHAAGPCPDWALAYSSGGYLHSRPDGRGGPEASSAILEAVAAYADAWVELACAEEEAGGARPSLATLEAVEAYKAVQIAKTPSNALLAKLFGAEPAMQILGGFLFA